MMISHLEFPVPRVCPDHPRPRLHDSGGVVDDAPHPDVVVHAVPRVDEGEADHGPDLPGHDGVTEEGNGGLVVVPEIFD